MSDTEKAALDSGTVGFDRELFTGDVSLKNLVSKYNAELTPEERAFQEKEVNELCEMLDDHQIMEDRDFPLEVWNYLRTKGFFSMIIPKQWGGKGISGHGHSQVVQKINSRSPSVGATVAVPNSLGPAELLMRYGTDEQKSYFLPKLASGEMIPCFGLTGPSSGSDAANMRDTGVITVQNGQLGIRATFNKRYITLAPVATCVGLAIHVTDPEGHLKGTGHEGITVCLLERSHPGLEMGPRHDPLTTSFMNGTVKGTDVFIPIEKVIGGQKRVGFGWNMLMDCLAEGRAISLPAGAVAAAKGTVSAVGAYARVRKQFKVPIAEMEGVQEHLARIASNTYIMVAGQHLVNAMINNHEQPAVLSGICKQQITNRGRQTVIDGMDVLGGAGIVRGPNNVLGNAYLIIPVAITVEGANTLTRNLIIFGQGLTRSHPYLYDLIKTIQKGDQVKEFSQILQKLVIHGATNFGRSLARAFTRSRGKGGNIVAHYESQLSRFAANFAFCSDVALVMGGKLKSAEYISGRFADILSNLYLGYACLWFYEKHKTAGLDKVLDLSMTNILYDIQKAFDGIFTNFPIPGVGVVMRAVTFPTGQPYEEPTDRQRKLASDLITKPGAVRDLLTQDIFHSKDPHDRHNLLLRALPKAVEADAILSKLKKEKRSATKAEQQVIDEAEALREEVIQVDAFPSLGVEKQAGADYVRPALLNPYKNNDNVKTLRLSHIVDTPHATVEQLLVKKSSAEKQYAKV
eukprot:TRINITY_DN3030_c0_g1_i1.p1 TRINITY_DN3030_c0_g1~~TRINITY_DN3030_c0_g1_i1.p1  ORF type:complete len:744 (-),score=221.45 TRINITY_DN3030_c0_g1_i1:134-2365(-)